MRAGQAGADRDEVAVAEDQRCQRSPFKNIFTSTSRSRRPCRFRWCQWRRNRWSCGRRLSPTSTIVKRSLEAARRRSRYSLPGRCSILACAQPASTVASSSSAIRWTIRIADRRRVHGQLFASASRGLAAVSAHADTQGQGQGGRRVRARVCGPGCRPFHGRVRGVGWRCLSLAPGPALRPPVEWPARLRRHWISDGRSQGRCVFPLTAAALAAA